ncbi:MAG: hypothetical protein ACTSUE_10665, partial [Promethearchaeota archaeon]
MEQLDALSQLEQELNTGEMKTVVENQQQREETREIKKMKETKDKASMSMRMASPYCNHTQKMVEKLYDSLNTKDEEREITVRIKPEPTNPYDPNAKMVMATLDGEDVQIN